MQKSDSNHPVGRVVRVTVGALTLGALLACGGGGSSGVSSPDPGTGTANLPQPVTGLTATVGNSPTVTLSWVEPESATSFNLYWSDRPGVAPASAQKIAGVRPPHIHDGLTGAKSYYYVVTATNAVGESVPSAEVSAVLPPDAPTAVSALPGDGVVAIRWAAVDGATQYKVYWSPNPGISKSSGIPIPGVSSPFLHQGLVNGTRYYYSVSALGSGGEGPLSATVSALPMVPAPSAPSNVSATLVPGSSPVVSIDWSAPAVPVDPAAVLYYRLYRSQSPGIASNLAAASMVDLLTGAPYLDPVLAGGLTYYYVMTAVTAAGEGEASAEVSVMVPEIGGGTGGASGGGSGGSSGSGQCTEVYVTCWQEAPAMQ